MTATAVARSSLTTGLRRYMRSWGVWLLLVTAVVAARFMVARDDGSGIQIAIGGHLPVMTSATLGVVIGIVVSTVLLPIGFLYLRSNTTRRQAWQIEEVAPGSRVAIMLGRFGADVAALLAMALALTFAGWLLGALIVAGPLNISELTLALWVVAAPALIVLAAIRLLFDALPWLRRGLGDFAFFMLWMAGIVVPVTLAREPAGFVVNMVDFMGFMRPLVAGAPGASDFMIGSSRVLPGRVPLDVMAGLASPGYLASRFAWVVVATLVVVGAGLVYRPHTARRGSRIAAATSRWFAAGAPPAVVADAPAASRVSVPLAGLVVAEFRLIGAGRLFAILALVAAVIGMAADFRHIGSPAAMLLLVFGMSAHAGRSEARGLLALSRVAALGPMLRRASFVVAGTGWALLLALPAALIRGSPDPLLLAAATGGTAALTAMILAAVSGSAFAPRLVLIVAWYVYLSS